MNGGRNCNMLFYDGDMEISIGAAFVFPGKDTKKMSSNSSIFLFQFPFIIKKRSPITV